MAISSTSSLSDLFKENYDSGSSVFTKQQNLKAKTWSKIPLSPLKMSPAGIVNAVSMRGNEAGGAANETEAFNSPGTFLPVHASVTPKYIFWPFQVSTASIELSEDNKTAFASMIDSQQQDNLGRMMSDINRQSLGKGTGQLSLANGAGVGATSLIVDSAIPFRVNMQIDSYVSIGGAKEINGATITAVNYATNTLTITPAQTWSDNTIIVKLNVQSGAPTGGKELSGVQAICDTTTYSTTFEGISVTTYPEWQGNVNTTGGAISQDLLLQTLNRAKVVGGSDPKFLISNHGQARNFLNSEIQKTRYEPTKIEGGNTILKWNDLEWLIDKDYDISEVGMYDMDQIFKSQTRDVHLADHDGKVLTKVSGYPVVAGYYMYVGNMGTWKRNAHARLTNLTEPSF